MADYKQVLYDGVVVSVKRASDGACIPLDPANTDYANYLAWVEAGGVPEGPPVPTLDELKAKRMGELQQLKGAALVAMQYTVGGETYTVTLSDRDIIDVQSRVQKLAAAPAGTTIRWEIVNGTFLTWGLADLEAMEGAGDNHISAVFANVDTLSAQITAATDAATLDAIDLTTGWPA